MEYRKKTALLITILIIASLTIIYYGSKINASWVTLTWYSVLNLDCDKMCQNVGIDLTRLNITNPTKEQIQKFGDFVGCQIDCLNESISVPAQTCQYNTFTNENKGCPWGIALDWQNYRTS